MMKKNKLESELSWKYWVPFTGTFKTINNFKYGNTLLNDSPKDMPNWKNNLRVAGGLINVAEQGICWFGLYASLYNIPEIIDWAESMIYR